jgi:hypothetical protein
MNRRSILRFLGVAPLAAVAPAAAVPKPWLDDLLDRGLPLPLPHQTSLIVALMDDPEFLHATKLEYVRRYPGGYGAL